MVTDCSAETTGYDLRLSPSTESERRMTDHATAVYFDHDPDPKSSRIGPEAQVGKVRLKRPPDINCTHPVVDFGKPERNGAAIHVDVLCLGCGHGWRSVKVVEAKP